MRRFGGMLLTEENYSSTRARSGNTKPRSYLVASQAAGREKGMDIVYEISLHTLYISLTCRKILRHGADSFTPPPKEGVLWINIALVNPLRPDLNPRTLDPVASTLTITPLTQLKFINGYHTNCRQHVRKI
jgi:hypothetical protein